MNKTKKGFNLLDVLIVLAVVCLVSGILWRQELTERIEKQDKENTVEVYCVCAVLPLDDGEKAALPENDVVLYYEDKEVGTFLGDYEEEEESAGEASEEEKHYSSGDGLVRIKLYAVEKESGYYIDDMKLVRGAVLDLNSELYELSLSINEIIQD